MASETSTATETDDDTTGSTPDENTPDENASTEQETGAEETTTARSEEPTATSSATPEPAMSSETTPAATGGAAAGAKSSDGALVGTAALVSAGLGLVSLTGSPLAEMMRAREELLGQIAAFSGGGGADQIETLYGAPWHTAALVNGVFALLAAIVGAVLAFGPARKPGAPGWARAASLAGLVLGVLGIIVAGGMYIDLFAAAPQMPAMPTMPGMGG
ncbi:hypothetical protein ACLFMI_22785 [Pseudonocardia nantongensis]|uniref:hypothetical protein n=1 Tax=Pseudonocardia nantongensis TaxID=1181885 RepID=UPI003979E152